MQLEIIDSILKGILWSGKAVGREKFKSHSIIMIEMATSYVAQKLNEVWWEYHEVATW